ncbi:hypothetical protein Ancab_027802 [Ancistrocladus abbreviatus]
METQDCNSSDIRPEAEVGSANASNNFSPDLIEDFNGVPSNQGDFGQSTIDPSARPFKKISIECLLSCPSVTALEGELWSSATISKKVLKTINVIFSNFQKLYTSEAATLCIPHLVNALKSGSEAA